MIVRVDKDVLAATVVALEDLAADLPGLFSRASNLGARVDLAPLNAAEQWASETAGDLRDRIGVLEQMALASPTFGGVRMTADQATQVAGQKLHVEQALIALSATATTPDAWESTDPANLSDWFEELEAKALQKLPGMSDAARAAALVDAYHQIQDLRHSSGKAVGAASQLLLKGGPALARWLAQSQIINPALESLATTSPRTANWLSGALNLVDSNVVRARTTFTYPGSFVPNLTAKVLLRASPILEDFDAWVARMSAATKPFAVEGEVTPTFLAGMLQRPAGIQATAWVSNILSSTDGGKLAARLSRWGNNVFGKPWINPVTEQAFGRGAGNLLTMANTSGVRTMAASAGALRVAGVAGSAFATVDSGIGLYNNFSENNERWAEGGTKGKAHVVGEYAEFAFNASMTAALIAPNPVTLGLVVISGTVWVGAKVVEHWDDIEDAAGVAADWAADRAEDADKWVGDRVDDIKKSDLNPMNWF
ncbi:hypothetical protein [Cellulomonas sp. URHE0023]|uniref:hypothetical protein n=1 Tax=Cellulomonas sp. URHE0023 TaxID=1380354 RepID=UPI000482C940|nr:hypothetical protein [Cellulomonas sp. URHE0023]